MTDLAIEQRVAELTAQRSAFVRARVVLAERPTSAKPGDEAIVLADGTIEGFVGGTCAESTVRAQSLALLDSGETLLLRITPDPGERLDSDDSTGRRTVHNPCLSGGSLEIFLAPVRPAPLVVVVGATPIARALEVLGRHLGFEARRVEPPSGSWVADDVRDAAAIVVASHGRDEEHALLAALDARVPYIGLVASPKRGAAVCGSLGRCASETAGIRTPAGLDIGARTPDEVALSILAEIVSLRPRPTGRPVAETGGDVASSAVDPVCGMTVAAVDTSLHLDHEGMRHWFCGSGCLRAFASDPAGYAPA
jgi:xanthine dehydrogenase accessory factor